MSGIPDQLKPHLPDEGRIPDAHQRGERWTYCVVYAFVQWLIHDKNVSPEAAEAIAGEVIREKTGTVDYQVLEEEVQFYNN
jgi:hypothetical protein